MQYFAQRYINCRRRVKTYVFVLPPLRALRSKRTDRVNRYTSLHTDETVIYDRQNERGGKRGRKEAKRRGKRRGNVEGSRDRD